MKYKNNFFKSVLENAKYCGIDYAMLGMVLTQGKQNRIKQLNFNK
jgi:hypothetical protein